MATSVVRKPASDMTSRYRRPPEKREPTSHRLPVSVIRKVEIIRELWKARAQADGEADENVDQINDTHVVSTLLAEAADAELAEFGGMPVDEAALNEMRERIRKKGPPKK